MDKKSKPHYVDNKKFLEAMVEYKKTVVEALDNDQEKPIIPNYIAECILKIALHLSYKPNFANYPFRDEMVSEGIENCLQYIDNFDPEKSKNPFAYFTQIVYYAFLRRIQKEKKYLYTKYKASEHINVLGQTSDRQDHNRMEQYDDGIKFSEWSNEYMSDFMQNFEDKKKKTRKRKLTRTVIDI